MEGEAVRRGDPDPVVRSLIEPDGDGPGMRAIVWCCRADSRMEASSFHELDLDVLALKGSPHYGARRAGQVGLASVWHGQKSRLHADAVDCEHVESPARIGVIALDDHGRPLRPMSGRGERDREGRIGMGVDGERRLSRCECCAFLVDDENRRAAREMEDPVADVFDCIDFLDAVIHRAFGEIVRSARRNAHLPVLYIHLRWRPGLVHFDPRSYIITGKNEEACK